MSTVRAMVSASPEAEAPRVKQLFVVLGLLLGVLLMHGVSAHHGHTMSAHHGHTMMSEATSAAAVRHGDGPTAMGHGGSSVSGGVAANPVAVLHSMGEMCCVAILVGALLLPLRSAFRLRRRQSDLRLPSPAMWAMAPKAAATRWFNAPSLTRLCVSRT
jgi:hypothetical protein